MKRIDLMLKRLLRGLVLLGSVVGVAALAPLTVALTAAPANDNFNNATLISSLPFSDSVDNTLATTEPGEPQPCNFSSQTVWYSITPVASAVLRADTAGSSFSDTQLTIYQAVAPGFGGLNFLGCAQFSNSSITFGVQAGTTYYLQAGSLFGIGGDLHLNLQVVPPPPNDDFLNAAPIAALPFSDTVDTAGASKETGEPTPSCAFNLGGTVWYAFTPARSGSVSASINATFSPLVAVYTGGSLTNLTELGCRIFGEVLTFHADAGTTYYFQVAGLFGQGGSLQFHLDAAPPPVASFSFSPSDPSIFDSVQFFDNSFDPGQAGFRSEVWDFGDGTTATGCCPTHQYATDNDYTVRLTVTTFDGRTASASQLVQVRTHDVAIIKISAPQSASAGQTRHITVDINSRRYPDYVQVQLLKSVPGGFGGFQFVGNLTQFVPVRPSNRTTKFDFSYTFTNDDAIVGKVTFKAVATIVGARDALPADNEAIASPTKVAP